MKLKIQKIFFMDQPAALNEKNIIVPKFFTFLKFFYVSWTKLMHSTKNFYISASRKTKMLFI